MRRRTIERVLLERELRARLAEVERRLALVGRELELWLADLEATS